MLKLLSIQRGRKISAIYITDGGLIFLTCEKLKKSREKQRPKVLEKWAKNMTTKGDIKWLLNI